MSNNTNNRVFVLISVNNSPKFNNRYPAKAAKKALTYLIKSQNYPGDKLIVFQIMDINSNKLYNYAGQRVKLQNPKTVNINGKNITFNHRTVVGRFNPNLIPNS